MQLLIVYTMTLYCLHIPAVNADMRVMDFGKGEEEHDGEVHVGLYIRIQKWPIHTRSPFFFFFFHIEFQRYLIYSI